MSILRQLKRTSLPVLAALLGAAIASGAQAQQVGSALTPDKLRAGAPKPPRQSDKTEAPPAAVPGAVARQDSVAPADRNAADLPPTEALFDAINRGDIITARDAISRGADLEGTNLLGLTPLELSVDLGRNDISFLLLSLRTPGSNAPRGAPGTVEAASPPPALTAAERRRAQREAQAQERVAKRAEAPSTGDVPARAPALFAGNGGTPVPSAGFLGFDPHH